jgi:urease accessory protein
MRARASIHATFADGRTRLVGMRSDPPLVVRETPDAVYLVGAAAGPLGCDELRLDVTVDDGATLAVRSAAATLAHPGPHGGRSYLHSRFDIGAAAHLTWRPEPLVSVRGSDHTIDTTVVAKDDATLVLCEEIVLGRDHEASGRVRSRIRVERGGRVVLTHELDVGADAPGWDSAAVLGSARAVVSMVMLGADAPTDAMSRVDPSTGARAAWLPLASGAAVLLSIAPGLRAARRAAADFDAGRLATRATAW